MTFLTDSEAHAERNADIAAFILRLATGAFFLVTREGYCSPLPSMPQHATIPRGVTSRPSEASTSRPTRH